MTQNTTQPLKMVTTGFSIESDRIQFQGEATVPAGLTTVDSMLPLARSISDRIVLEMKGAVEAAGEQISCKKGCGACCRKLIPLSAVEARRIRDLVEASPEPRRTEIRARFADTERRLDQAGMLEYLKHPGVLQNQEYLDVCADYFQLGIACPFLEEESCSIYAERPIACREYLVTSPAENCAGIAGKAVIRVRLPLFVFNAVTQWNSPDPDRVDRRWVPLPLAPQWAETHPDESLPKSGVDLFAEFLRHLTGAKKVSGKPPSDDLNETV